MKPSTLHIVGLSMVALWCGTNGFAAEQRFNLQKNDVVAFIGGESVVQQGDTGHLESLLVVSFPNLGVRYRNLGWEGDTVFEQPRDLNFPGLAEQLKKAGATVIIAQFGAAEAVAGKRDGVARFAEAYDRLCDTLSKQTTRIVLVTPPKFDRPPSPLLPDLSLRNDDLRLYADATVALAKRRGLQYADVFNSESSRTCPITTDGVRQTPAGSAYVATLVCDALRVNGQPAAFHAKGHWIDPALESVRQAVIEKNRLWFDYWRPMNWAFLGGDRTFTQSSRDPNDLNVRIFPRELEKFTPLIEKADAKVDELARPQGGTR